MTTRLVQITDRSSRRVALVEEPYLRCLTSVFSVYELAQLCQRNSQPMANYALTLSIGETLLYDDIYHGHSPWRLLSPIDVPDTPSRLLVAGTSLTHLGSASNVRRFTWPINRSRKKF